jgi:hypothetical protein
LDPGPILLSKINLALCPVAYLIIEPSNLTGLNKTFGLSNPSFDIFHSTLLTTTYAYSLVIKSLKAKPHLIVSMV